MIQTSLAVIDTPLPADDFDAPRSHVSADLATSKCCILVFRRADLARKLNGPRQWKVATVHHPEGVGVGGAVYDSTGGLLSGMCVLMQPRMSWYQCIDSFDVPQFYFPSMPQSRSHALTT